MGTTTVAIKFPTLDHFELRKLQDVAQQREATVEKLLENQKVIAAALLKMANKLAGS